MILILLFISIFLSYPILHVIIKNYVRDFSGKVKARILKFGIHINNELFYCVIEK